jgi:hypothetical protein
MARAGLGALDAQTSHAPAFSWALLSTCLQVLCDLQSEHSAVGSPKLPINRDVRAVTSICSTDGCCSSLLPAA